MTLKDKTNEEITEAVKSSSSFQGALRKLTGVQKPHNGAQSRWLRKKIDELNLDTSHMTHSNRGMKGFYKGIADEMLPEIFCLNSKFVYSNRRDLIISRNLIPYKCAICGNEGEWMGKPLTLTLDHINGNHLDNRLENLRFVCPNCDRQLSTFGSKNKVRYNEPVSYSNNSQIKPVKNYCKICGKEISKGSQICLDCYHDKLGSQIPTREEVEFTLLNEPTFLAMGKKYNVSDNAFRKWCKKYKLPYKLKDLKQWKLRQK